MRRVAVEAGLDPEEMYPHRLRRTVAVMFLQKANNDLPKLCAFMGWRDLSTAMQYVDYAKLEDIEAIWSG